MPISVKYFCRSCMTPVWSSNGHPSLDGFKDVTVRDRREDEDIVNYVREVARIVGIHHSHRGCTNLKVDLAIHFDPQTGRVGDKSLNRSSQIEASHATASQTGG